MKVFVRDADRKSARCTALSDGKSSAREFVPELAIAGGCAEPCIEGWVAAIDGRTGTAARSVPAAVELAESVVGTSCTAADLAAFIERKGLDSIAADASELLAFVDELRALAASSA